MGPVQERGREGPAQARRLLDDVARSVEVTVVPGNHDIYVRGALDGPSTFWGDYMRGDHGEEVAGLGERVVPAREVAAVVQVALFGSASDMLRCCSASPEQREGLIRLVMEGHLRGIIGQLTVEEIVKQPEMVAERMRSTCADDMNKMGLEVISFTIKEVRDKNEYITNMGKPDVARIKRDADVATAEAERDTAS